MNDPNDVFRDKLLRQESVNSDLKEKYAMELQAILEKRLSPLQQWSFLAGGIAAIASAVMDLAIVYMVGDRLPPVARYGLFALAALAVAAGVVGVNVFRKGIFNRRVDAAKMSAALWLFVVLLVTIFLIAAPDSVAGLRMILFALTFLVFGAVSLLRHVIEQGELATQERMLELELRLAEVAESIAEFNRPRAG